MRYGRYEDLLEAVRAMQVGDLLRWSTAGMSKATLTNYLSGSSPVLSHDVKLWCRYWQDEVWVVRLTNARADVAV